MAIAQEILITEPGLSFDDWVASLTGDAKTAALAAKADADSKFDAQVSAGNVYISASGARIWASAEAEAEHMSSLSLEYGLLWEQWQSETGGALTINIKETPSTSDTIMTFPVWAQTNLSPADYATFISESEAIAAAVVAGSTEGKVTVDDSKLEGHIGTYTVTDEAYHNGLKATYPIFKSAKDAYDAYVAAL